MKKISIFLALVALVMTLFAINVFAASFTRGPEGDTIAADDLACEIELVSGTTAGGQPSYVLDGSYASKAYWSGGANGSAVKVTFANEWEITDAKAMIINNYTGIRISFYAADDTLLGEANTINSGNNSGFIYSGDSSSGTYESFNSALSKIKYGDDDKAVKYIIVTKIQDKWGWLPGVAEVVLTGRERIPSVGCEKHEFAPYYPVEPGCETTGTVVNKCVNCGAEEAPATAPALGHKMGEYTIKTPATCDTAAVIEYECERCGLIVVNQTHIKDVTDYVDFTLAGSNGAGGYTTSHYALFDNNMDSYLHASGGWFVESWIELDQAYYITSVTVWTDSWSDNNSWEAFFTFYYQAPGSDEWVTVSPTKSAGVGKAGEKNSHTLELATPVYADAIKIKVDRLASFQGQAFEAEVAGTLFADPQLFPKGHTWEETGDVPSACYAGYTLSTCTTCGATKQDEFTKAVGHVWADATCIAPKTCTVCALTEGEAVDDAHFYDGADDAVCNGCDYVRGVARVGEQYFATLEEAIAAGDEIIVIGKVTVEGDATWNFAGKTITLAYADENNYAVVVKGNLTIVDGTFNVQALFGFGVTGTLTVNGGTFNADATYVDYMIGSWGTTVINNGTFNGKYCNVNAFAGTATINGGSFVVAGDDSGYDPIDVEGYTTINAGTFSTDVSAFVAEGKCQYANGVIAADISDTYYAVDGMEIKIENGIAYVMGGEYALSYDAVNNSYTSNSPRVSFGFDRGGNLVFGMGGQLHKHTADMYIATVTAPTCTKDGYTTYECMGCGHTYTDNVVPATGHGKAVIKEEIAPTCTADGSITKVCAECGEVVSKETIPAAHTWDEGTTQLWPNCKNTGIERYTCTVCGEIHTEELPIDPENHNYWPDWSTQRPATCIQGGYAKEVCQICGDVQENITEPDTEYGHEWVINKETFVPATCIKDGYRERKCALCNAEEAGALDKDIFGEHIYVTDKKPATCKEDGYTKTTCELCDYLYEEEIPANDWSHDYNYSANGIFKECAICGDWGLRDTIKGGNEEAVADYSIYFSGSDVINIYHTEDYSVLDEYYNYTIAKNEDGTYTLTIAECYNGNDTFKLANTTAKFEIVENGGILTFTNADGAVYTFDNIPEEEPDQPEVDNNSIINGIYETADGSVKVQFKDGVATVLVNEAGAPLPETFEYDYNSMTGMIDCDGVQMIVSYSINDKAIYFGMMPLYKVGESGDDEPDEPEVNYGDKIGSMIVTTTDTYGPFDLYSYTAEKAGLYSFFIPANLGVADKDHVENFATPVFALDYFGNLGTYVQINLEAGQTLEFYIIAETKQEWTIDVYYLAPAHVHTEVEIPAVLPTPSTTGYTAGIKCSACGEYIVEPQEVTVNEMADTRDPNFRVASAALSLQDSISVIYKSVVTAGYNNPYMVFVFRGEEYIYTESTIDSTNGRYVFTFDAMLPQFMNENIEAYVYAETAEGQYSMNSILEYSVKKYCTNQLAPNKTDEALKVLVSDVLVYGSWVQKYVGYKTNELVADIAKSEGFTLVPSMSIEELTINPDVNVQAVLGDRTTGTDWKSGALRFGEVTKVDLKFIANDISDLVLKINIDGTDTYYEVTEEMWSAKESRYVLTIDTIKSYQYGDTITATFMKGGEQIGSTLTYSINSYLYRNYQNTKLNEENPNTLDSLKALYIYGQSVYNYFNK